jgi:hypothetical protein
MKKLLIAFTVGLAAAFSIVAAAPLASAEGQAANASSAASEMVSAQTAPAGCPSGYLCFWKDINYGGAMGKVAGNNLNFTAFRNTSCQTGTWNDCISSVYNNGARCTVAIYRDANYLGGGLTVPRQTGISNLGTYGLNDAISSNRWC